MYYFLFGKNTYSIEEKIGQLRARFLKTENSDFNLAVLDGATLTKNSFIGQAMASPFLSNKRLVIIKNLLLENKDKDLQKYIAESLVKIPESSVVFFSELGEPDMRTVLFKRLNQPKIAQKFDLFTQRQLADWIEERCQQEGLFIDTISREELAQNSGGDLWFLDNELKKLFLYLHSQKKDRITEADISLLVTKKEHSDIFEFIESLAQKNLKKAVLALNKLKNTGENEIYLLSMVIYQFRTMLIVEDLSSKKITGTVIAKEAKLHPFVVTKTLALLRHYTKPVLVDIYDLLQGLDAKIKTGRIDPSVAIDLMIAKICQDQLG